MYIDFILHESAIKCVATYLDLEFSNNDFILVFQVKNKAPAEIQITAEQLLREAKERDLEIVPPVSKFTFIMFIIYSSRRITQLG